MCCCVEARKGGSLGHRKGTQMRGFLVFVLIGLAALGWFLGPGPGSLLLSGMALTGGGVLARRMRLPRKERV
jgi:hypothetical protein